mgnify:CR=1 FL=1
MKIAFIGLGIMGGNMASHLAKNNLNLTVYNRTPKNFETFGNSTVTIADSIENAIKTKNVVKWFSYRNNSSNILECK